MRKRLEELLKIKNASSITRITDGIEALALLRGEDGMEKLKSPYIILLDINMPRMISHNFLEQKRQPCSSELHSFCAYNFRNEQEY